MALNDADAKDADAKKAPAPSPAPKNAVSAPGWLLSLYLGGLVLVYLGERVLSGLEKGAGFFTGLGALAVLGSTFLRFSPRFRGGGERLAIERLQAILSLIGVVALAFYALTTDWGAATSGIERLAEPARTRTLDFLTVAWITLVVIATLPMVFVETALRPMRSSERPESQRVHAAAGAGLTLALALVYGCFFVYSAAGVDLDVDFSYFKTSRASESTKKLAASVSDPVRVVAFFPPVNEVRTEVERYLDDLKPAAPKLKIEVLDRLLVPKTARDLRVTQDGVIVLSKGGVTHSLSLGTELEQAKPKLKTLDRDFQEQLTKLARSRRTVYFTVGHGELNDQPRAPSGSVPRSSNILKTLLQRQNLVVKDLGLAQGLANEVPNDADLVMVLGPSEPFSKQELETLSRYAKRGGKLFLALDRDAVSTKDLVTGEGGSPEATPVASAAAPKASAAAAPAKSATPAASASAAPPKDEGVPEAPEGPLDELARVVGLAFSSDVLANQRVHVRFRGDESDRARLVVQSFSSHASVSTLSRAGSRAAVIFFGAGSLDRAPGSTVRADFAVRSATGTFGDKNGNYSYDSALEKQAVYNLAAAVSSPIEGAPAEPSDDAPDAGTASGAKDGKDEKKKGDKKKDDKDDKKDVNEHRAFVVADADAFSDFVLGEVMTNQLLFVDAVRWLVGEESVAGMPNTEEDKRIQHTKQEDLAWFYASIFGAPALVLGAGMFASRRSRRQKGGKS